MSANKASSEIPITPEDIRRYLAQATATMKAVRHQPKRKVSDLATETKPSSGLSFSALGAPQEVEQLSLFKLGAALSGGDELMEENCAAVLGAIRTGLTVAQHVAALFEKTAGLERLRERAGKNQLSTAEQGEWARRQEAQAAIVICVLSSFVTWKLAEKEAEALSGVSVDFRGLPEPLVLRSPMQAQHAALFHFGSYLALAQSGLEALKYAQLYFRTVLDDVIAQAKNIAASAAEFTDKHYRLQGTPFTIAGFESAQVGGRRLVEFAPVTERQIVGNHEAKKFSLRIARFLMAYDFERKKNPMIEFGAFPYMYLYMGEPGTGKTMLIKFAMTLVRDYCAELDIPFRVHELPGDIISTYQGGSGERFEQWWSVLRNPGEIIVAPIDDAENVFQDRTMQNVSSGSKEVIASLLRCTEGALAINRGNVIIPWATNIPDMIDAAAMSRIMAKMPVPGAVTRNDFNDQMRLWGEGLDKMRPGLVDLAWPRDYEYLSDQNVRIAAGEKARVEQIARFSDERINQLYESVRARGITARSYDLYGTLFSEIKRTLPKFTSREVRNVTTVVMSRLFDVDFPAEWLSDRKYFVDQSYDVKKQLIIDLALARLKGMSVADVLHEETVRAVNTMVEIIDGGRRRRVRDLAREMAERKDALTLVECGEVA